MERKLLVETLTNFYRLSGFIEPHLLAESKATEKQAMKLLTTYNVENPEELIGKFIKIDEPGGKNIAAMAYFVAQGERSVDKFKSVFDNYIELSDKKRIPKMVVTKRGVVLGDNIFKDFIKFSEFIHGKKNNFATKTKDVDSNEDLKEDDIPIETGENIEIFAGDDVGRCIRYGSGGLNGKYYSFCIGSKGPDNMWYSYRSTKDSTFYYIVDRNRDDSDPLHMVVFDHTNDGIELTDENNDTGNIAEFGENVSGYINYLKSKNVDVDKLVNTPKTKEEIEEEEKFGEQNPDLKWFMSLTPEDKYKYIGRGHPLTDEQFDFLIN